MGLNIWEGLNVGLEFDEDEQESNFKFTMDHDEVKGDLYFELKVLLEEELNEGFDTAEDVDAIQEIIIPEYEGMKKYLTECIEMIDAKIVEAKGFVEENS